MREVGPVLESMIAQHAPQLAAQPDAELAARRAGGEEPALPTPRPDGVLASITDDSVIDVAVAKP
jgi:hypothetical protein